MQPLTKPGRGVGLDFRALIFHLNFAKTFIWAEDVLCKNGDIERRKYFLKLSIAQRLTRGHKLLTIVLGPLKVVIGW